MVRDIKFRGLRVDGKFWAGRETGGDNIGFSSAESKSRGCGAMTIAEPPTSFIAGKDGYGIFFSKIHKFYDDLRYGLIPAWDMERRHKEAYA